MIRNLDYLLEQWVTIFQCNIYLVGQDHDIQRVYGESNPEADPLYRDPALFELLLAKEDCSSPTLYCEFEAVLYGILPFQGKRLLIGPVSIKEPVEEFAGCLADAHRVSREGCIRIAFCDKHVFCAGLLALCHGITGQEWTAKDLWPRSDLVENEIRETRASVQQVIFQRQEKEIPHNPYDQEKREMDSIRRGDSELLKRSLQEVRRGEIGQLSRDGLRQAKNIAICVVTLASRAAIEGGMLPEEAFSMVDGYILKIEDMTDVVKIEAAMRQAEFEFTKRVSAVHGSAERNAMVDQAKNYIFQNLHNEIMIGEIGHQIGISSAWLSTLFHRVEGITIQQYIRRERIRLAENLLRYSDYDIKSIASYLAFCTQSHFGRAFKEQTGMTPTRYREKFGDFQKNKNI